MVNVSSPSWPLRARAGLAAVPVTVKASAPPPALAVVGTPGSVLEKLNASAALSSPTLPVFWPLSVSVARPSAVSVAEWLNVSAPVWPLMVTLVLLAKLRRSKVPLPLLIWVSWMPPGAGPLTTLITSAAAVALKSRLVAVVVSSIGARLE